MNTKSGKECCVFLDCTLRDGGYYNSWDFSVELINQYLEAVHVADVDVVELGFRSLENRGFQGPCAFTTDDFVRSLSIPDRITLGVMVNGSELVGSAPMDELLQSLFPNSAANSPIGLVRIACHIHEFESALPAAIWLKAQGFRVGFNLMQIADCSDEKLKALAREARNYSLDVLYFADSMGSMNPEHVAKTVGSLRSEWEGELGIHTHDNLGLALSNTLRAIDEGVSWIDSTVTGMGRGPGNARTEELAIEIARIRHQTPNLVPLMTLLRKYFKPMKSKYGWGTNPYYYLAGMHGIHPSFVQEMLSDSRYEDEDVLAVIEHLRIEGGKKFSLNVLDSARHFYSGEISGNWSPRKCFANKNVLVIGAGPSVSRHRDALSRYIRKHNPVVLALNAQSIIEPGLVDLRVACHPARVLADCQAHSRLPHPLITPYSMLPGNVQATLKDKDVFDFGIRVQPGEFEFANTHCTVPSYLVIAYALAAVTSGQAKNVLMAGFDGYGSGDMRNHEMQTLLDCYQQAKGSLSLTAVTPTSYNIPSESIYAL